MKTWSAWTGEIKTECRWSLSAVANPATAWGQMQLRWRLARDDEEIGDGDRDSDKWPRGRHEVARAR